MDLNPFVLANNKASASFWFVLYPEHKNSIFVKNITFSVSEQMFNFMFLLGLKLIITVFVYDNTNVVSKKVILVFPLFEKQ